MKSFKKNLCNDSACIDSDIKLYYHSIFKIAFTFVKNKCDSEDIVQETFLEFLMNKHQFESEEHEKAWLIKVVINKSKDFLNSYWNKNTEVLSEKTSFEFTKEESDLFDVISSLDEKYKTVIYLYYYEKYTISEIVFIINSNSNNVCQLLKRGRSKIKRILENDYDYHKNISKRFQLKNNL